MTKTSIRFFKDKEVRAIWDDNKEKWFFSAIDIVGILNNEFDYTKTSNYWRWLKKQLKTKNSQLVSDTHRLKMTAADGKMREVDVFDSDGIIKLAKAIPNPNIEFLDWFVYSEQTIDGQSKKKAYQFFESNLIKNNDIGKTKSLLQIHEYIFGGLYSFAGKIRTKNISKSGFMFANAMFLDKVLEEISNKKQNTFELVVEKYVEMNVAHPFMEGNGRSTRIWLDLILKKELKKCIDWSKINKTDYLQAMILSHNDSSKITALLKNALTDKINDREMFIKGIDYSYYYEEE
ncbi:MAG: Fic family protein [Mycoplasmataceae bacterium]|nr:Fic family protein [Mycoplasmataceae bacterium]